MHQDIANAIKNEPDQFLRDRILTCDGRGVEYKARALDELIARAVASALAHARETSRIQDYGFGAW